MRLLNEMETGLVCGAEGVCTPSDPSGNTYGGVTNTKAVGDELIAIYEGVVSAASHIIERVANAL